MQNNRIVFGIIVVSLQFASGSIMYAYLIARILKINLRNVRDGNPGSYNLWISAGWKWGLLGVILDFLKGVLPLSIFMHYFGSDGNRYLFAIAALSGILGHAFSPMLKFKGGKAIATSFGAWFAMTKLEAPLFLALVLLSFTTYYKLTGKEKTSPEEDAFRVIVSFLVLSLYVLWKAYRGSPELLTLYFGNLIILIFKHWHELKKFVTSEIYTR